MFDEYTLHQIIKTEDAMFLEDLLETYIRKTNKNYQRPNPFGTNPYGRDASEAKMYILRGIQRGTYVYDQSRKITLGKK